MIEGVKAEKSKGGSEKRYLIDFHRIYYRQLLRYKDFDCEILIILKDQGDSL